VRIVSEQFKRSVFAQEVNDDYVPLLTITWNDPVVGAGTLRFARHHTSITSRGNTFLPMAFDLEMGVQSERELPRVKLTLDNVDRVIVQELEKLNTPAHVLVEVVLDSDHETVEGSTDGTVRFANYDARAIELELDVLPAMTVEPFGGYRFRKSDGFNATR
jgi:hypothetical protein